MSEILSAIFGLSIAANVCLGVAIYVLNKEGNKAHDRALDDVEKYLGFWLEQLEENRRLIALMPHKIKEPDPNTGQSLKCHCLTQ